MQLVFAAQCLLCRAFCRAALCDDCHRDVAKLSANSRCPQCGVPANGVCGVCLKSPPAYDRTWAALTYARPLSTLVRDFKFHGRWQMTQLLAGFMRAPAADMMIPVPLFFAREQWRGFNQARELARAMPGPKPPLHEELLSRVVNTHPQSRMPDAAARRRNLKKAFLATPAVRGKTLLVVDDVMSSGVTLNEVARALKKEGAAAVFNLVVARAAPGIRVS